MVHVEYNIAKDAQQTLKVDADALTMFDYTDMLMILPAYICAVLDKFGLHGLMMLPVRALVKKMIKVALKDEHGVDVIMLGSSDFGAITGNLKAQTGKFGNTIVVDYGLITANIDHNNGVGIDYTSFETTEFSLA